MSDISLTLFDIYKDFKSKLINNMSDVSLRKLFDRYQDIKSELIENIKKYNNLNILNDNKKLNYNEMTNLYKIILSNINTLNDIQQKILKSPGIISNNDKIFNSWRELNISYNKVKEQHNKLLIDYNTNNSQNKSMSIEVNSNNIKYTGIILINIILIYYLIKSMIT